MFAETLKKVVDNVDGGIAAMVMGIDGIAIESYTRQADRIDINNVGMEFSFILTQVARAAESAGIGRTEEMSIRAERLVLVTRMLSEHYFLCIALAPEGNFGKARFLARMAAPSLTANLM